MKKRYLPLLFSLTVVLTIPATAQKNQGSLRNRLNVENSAPDRTGPLGGYANVVERVSPSVVSIVVTSKAPSIQTTIPDLFDDPLFRRFFGDPFGDQRQGPQSRPRQLPTPKRQGQGSGVILTNDGYIVTNNHVIDSAEEIEVSLPGDRETYGAKVVGTDPKTDLALIKIDKTGLPAITVGDSSLLKPGDTVLAIGSPFGLSQTVTTGIVSATGRRSLGLTGRDGYENFIQTDASINPGNSGGALIDNKGRLIGINTAIFSRSGGNMGIGFAIPVNLAVNIMDRLMSDGEVRRGFLGVTIGDLTPELAQGFGVEAKGALVNSVNPDTPAADAGIEPGDIIVKFDGKDVADVAGLRFMVANTDPGRRVGVEVIRQGQNHKFTVQLGRLPGSQVADAPNPQQNGGGSTANSEFLPGVTVAPLTEAARANVELPSDLGGVVVASVDPDSNAAEALLQPGDVIVSINRQAVSSPAEAVKASKNAGNIVILRVFTQGGARFVAIPKG